MRSNNIFYNNIILDWLSVSRNDLHSGDKERSEFARRPQFSNSLLNHSVPVGGTIALQVEVEGKLDACRRNKLSNPP